MIHCSKSDSPSSTISLARPESVSVAVDRLSQKYRIAAIGVGNHSAHSLGHELLNVPAVHLQDSSGTVTPHA